MLAIGKAGMNDEVESLISNEKDRLVASRFRSRGILRFLQKRRRTSKCEKRNFAFCIMFAFFVTSSGAFAEESADIQMYPSCIHCGMDRKMFAHSRIIIPFDD